MIERNHRRVIVISMLSAMLVLSLTALGCSRADSTARAQLTTPSSGETLSGTRKDPEPGTNVRVTFVELGSDSCIPCIKMREVMKEIQERYGDQVRIVFHDVWTPEGEPYARQFGIQVIPTQVFLDSKGQEYFRHEGYFPTTEVVKIFALKGI